MLSVCDRIERAVKDHTRFCYEKGVKLILEGDYKHGLRYLRVAVDLDSDYRGRVIHLDQQHQIEVKPELDGLLLDILYESYLGDDTRQQFRSVLRKFEEIEDEYRGELEKAKLFDKDIEVQNCYEEMYCPIGITQAKFGEFRQLFDEVLTPLEIAVLFYNISTRDTLGHSSIIFRSLIQNSYEAGHNNFYFLFPEGTKSEFVFSNLYGNEEQPLEIECLIEEPHRFLLSAPHSYVNVVVHSEERKRIDLSGDKSKEVTLFTYGNVSELNFYQARKGLFVVGNVDDIAEPNDSLVIVLYSREK